jgi:hypothetical protein
MDLPEEVTIRNYERVLEPLLPADCFSPNWRKV